MQGYWEGSIKRGAGEFASYGGRGRGKRPRFSQPPWTHTMYTELRYMMKILIAYICNFFACKMGVAKQPADRC